MSAPAIAGELASWRFDPTENVLEFTTNEGVQPRAQLVPDPTRLVIDLPGTLIGNVQHNQALSGAFRQIRIGQLDVNTARIVVELTPGYMLDPQQVRFQGISPTQWTVQLPLPQYMGTGAPTPDVNRAATNAPAITSAPSLTSGVATSSDSPPYSLGTASSVTAPVTAPVNPSLTLADPPDRSPDDPSFNSPAAIATGNGSVTQIEGIQVTEDGLFLRTTGVTPDIDDIDRSRDRRSITVTIANAILSPQVTQGIAIGQFGIEQLQFEQISADDDEPPAVEITLEVDRDSPNWNATASGLGGIVLLPQQRVVSRRSNSRHSDSSSRNASSRNASSRNASSRHSESRSDSQNSLLAESPTPAQTVSDLPIATIAGIELDASGTQLLIRSDRPMTYAGRWQSGIYQVQLSPARLAEQVTGPQLDTSSPLLRVRLRQDDNDTVVVMIQPAAGVRFGSLNAVSSQLLALDMERSQATVTASAMSSISTNSTFQPQGSPANLSGFRIPNGRIVVVIDPGHGGADVGAVGVGDIHEADIVLPIAQQVGALLQQQGIQVVMTRNDDREIDLEPRVQMAERANATLFVSIHANSMGMDRPDVNGTETYYYSSGAGLAQVIQTSITSTVGTNDRGIKQARFYVLRRTTMPAVLVEIGYVTGNEDGPRLADSNFRSQLARAIAQGILQYTQSMASQ
jgi:N-acetylmuramoyl-L-alanine amidase